MLKWFVHRAGRWYIERICRSEFYASRFSRRNERPIEYRFVFECATQLCPRTILDVGTGQSALPALLRTCGYLVTAIDNVRDYWPHGMLNRHYHILNDDIRRPTLGGPFDLLTCVSVLEHVRESEAAVRGMFSLLRPGGHLILTHPYNETRYCRNVYERPDSFGRDLPYPGQQFSRKELNAWLQQNNATLERQEFWHCYESEFWACGAQVEPPRRVGMDEPHELTCLLLKKADPRDDIPIEIPPPQAP